MASEEEQEMLVVWYTLEEFFKASNTIDRVELLEVFRKIVSVR